MEQPLPLIGRDREMGVFRTLLDRGRPAVLLVEGPPDSGRARFLRECAVAGVSARIFPDKLVFETGLVVTTTLPDAEVHRLVLGPLCPEDVRRLVTAALREGRPGERLLDLARVAAGRPGAVVRLVAGLRSEGLLRAGDGVVVPVPGRLPESFRVRLADRLALLSPAARHLVQAATALPSPFPPARLAGLLGAGVVTLLPVIEEALDSGLLVAAGDSLGFGHEVVRGVVEGSMPRAVVAALHAERNTRPRAGARHRQPRAAGAAGGTAVRGTAGEESRAAAGHEGGDVLSEREWQIAELVGMALTNRQIASRVGISPHTVNYHLRQIFRKLGMSSRVEVVSFLQRRAVKPVV
ncbi:LuxR C-terminal-related transcriptional regulator [Actinoplanes sp. NPDC023714]|uniref:helix-turn-helix transcriptional regulator n=1 Tax=Actinoplanes sp. NPDC023714 TaxID=3154322 RepID=UPI0033D83393